MISWIRTWLFTNVMILLGWIKFSLIMILVLFLYIFDVANMLLFLGRLTWTSIRESSFYLIIFMCLLWIRWSFVLFRIIIVITSLTICRISLIFWLIILLWILFWLLRLFLLLLLLLFRLLFFQFNYQFLPITFYFFIWRDDWI